MPGYTACLAPLFLSQLSVCSMINATCESSGIAASLISEGRTKLNRKLYFFFFFPKEKEKYTGNLSHFGHHWMKYFGLYSQKNCGATNVSVCVKSTADLPACAHKALCMTTAWFFFRYLERLFQNIYIAHDI